MASLDTSKRKILKAKKTLPASCRKQVEMLSRWRTDELQTAAAEEGGPPGDGWHRSARCGDSGDEAAALAETQGKPPRADSEARLDSAGKRRVCPQQKPSRTGDRPREVTSQEARGLESPLTRRAPATGPAAEEREGGRPPPPRPAVTDERTCRGAASPESRDRRPGDGLRPDTHSVLFIKTPTLAESLLFSSSPADPALLAAIDAADSGSSQSQKKRMFAENKESVKRMRTSEQIREDGCERLQVRAALLEQVKHLIRQEVCSRSHRLFDDKLQELTERIGMAQCRNKHAAVADELLTKIARLQRRIKTVLLAQRNCVEPSTLSNGTDCKVTTSGAVNLLKKQESVNGLEETKTCLNNRPSERASERIDLSRDDDGPVLESNDDVLLVSVGSSDLKSPVTADPTGPTKVTFIDAENSPTAEIEVLTVVKKRDSVIDLTEDLSTCNIALCSSIKCPDPFQCHPSEPECPASTVESVLKPVSVSKEANSTAQDTAQALESLEDLPPLPGLPPLEPEPREWATDTLPPQKPELKVKRVLRPQGIALSWNISKIDPRCAPVDSYHLFLCHADPDGELSWKKIGEVKAMPLPMACTLSQFLSHGKHYFTVQSKDIFGRYGPFCDIKAVSGFSENLT